MIGCMTCPYLVRDTWNDWCYLDGRSVQDIRHCPYEGASQ